MMKGSALMPRPFSVAEATLAGKEGCPSTPTTARLSGASPSAQVECEGDIQHR
jgi:hypothetical protein